MKITLRVLVLFAGCAVLAGCDRYSDSRYQSGLREAEHRFQIADSEGAIRAYEMLLDGTQKTAEAHYRLGHLYADKLKNPMGALHHFSRYLAIAPEGPFAKEARDYQREGEMLLLNQIGKGSPLTQDEAAKLKNENLNLRKQVAELKDKKSQVPPAAGAPGAVSGKNAKGEALQKPIPPGARTYTVAAGDTLGAIAQKVYKNKARWKEIQDANFYTADGGLKLKPGQELIIP